MVYIIRDIANDARGKASNETIAFTGDFLFMASWGMFFEGTPTQMQRWFDKFLEAWPPDTYLLYGHEYSVDDLKFAAFVDPDNDNVQRWLEQAEENKEQKKINLPGQIKDELTFNPFLRAGKKEMLKISETDNTIDSLRVLRQWKDAKKHVEADKKDA